MACLLVGGIAAQLLRDNNLLLAHQTPSMSSKLRIGKDFEEVERAFQKVCHAPSELIAKLSAAERILAREIRNRFGVTA